jgi:hypothetical protein
LRAEIGPSLRRLGTVAVITLVLTVLTGCGSFQPFATPFVPRPALPPGDAFPDMTVEEAIERLELLGFDCEYAPDSDIPGGWRCIVGDQGLAVEIDEIVEGMEGNEAGPISVGIAAGETGPFWGVFGSVGFGPDHPKEALDEAAASAFSEVMLAVFVPEEVQPTGPELVEMVAANWPTELGAGWLLDFGHNSILRTMRIVYSEADADN